jgi:hypothetical protein
MKAALGALTLSLLLSFSLPQRAHAWGDDGHKAVALIADHYLAPDVRRTIAAMLAADTDPLTQHDIASEATWADKYRNHHRETAKWHFTDIEIDHPDINEACFGREQLAPGTLASNGSPDSCAIDKIKQFADELASSKTDSEEKIIALKFVLHFVGDLHQPLHSSDNHDKGGNAVKVIVDGFDHKPRDELHAFWDTQFVDALGASPAAIAQQLIETITPEQKAKWEQGSLDDWAMEAFAIAKSDVYGNPPLSKDVPQHLDQAYVDRAERDVRLQLSRAGVRLAAVLNKTLRSANGTVALSAPTSPSVTSQPAQTSTLPADDLTTGSIGGTDQFATEAEALKHCPSGTVVWANLRSNVYHFAGYPSYGNTKRGAFMCEADATHQDMHAAKAERRP